MVATPLAMGTVRVRLPAASTVPETTRAERGEMQGREGSEPGGKPEKARRVPVTEVPELVEVSGEERSGAGGEWCVARGWPGWTSLRRGRLSRVDG